MAKVEADALFEEHYRVIRRGARKHAWNHRGVGAILGFEDLVQEGLIAAWKSLSRYDAEKSQVSTYTWNVIWRHLQGVLGKEMAQKRMLHGWLQNDESGEWEFKAWPQLPSYNEQVILEKADTTSDVRGSRGSYCSMLDDPVLCEYIENATPNPDQAYEWSKEDQITALLRLQVLYRLGGREGKVFMAKVTPPDPDFTSNVEIANLLGLTVNQVNWSLIKIRGVVNDVIQLNK